MPFPHLLENKKVQTSTVLLHNISWNQFIALALQLSNFDIVLSREQIQLEVVKEQNTQ